MDGVFVRKGLENMPDTVGQILIAVDARLLMGGRAANRSARIA